MLSNSVRNDCKLSESLITACCIRRSTIFLAHMLVSASSQEAANVESSSRTWYSSRTFSSETTQTGERVGRQSSSNASSAQTFLSSSPGRNSITIGPSFFIPLSFLFLQKIDFCKFLKRSRLYFVKSLFFLF